jgi:hypothetical protein
MVFKRSPCQLQNRDDAQFRVRCGRRLTAGDFAAGVAPVAQDATPVAAPGQSTDSSEERVGPYTTIPARPSAGHLLPDTALL